MPLESAVEDSFVLDFIRAGFKDYKDVTFHPIFIPA
jgi:hypothetical protein